MKTLIILVLGIVTISTAIAKQAESDLLTELHSGDYWKMEHAMQTLPDDYPNSDEARKAIGFILVNSRTVEANEIYANHNGIPIIHRVIATVVARDAARALGNYHATLTPDELSSVYELLRSRTVNDSMDALKTLRGTHNPECIPVILPFLDDANIHVRRDTIRTLAVIGDKSLIPKIEPRLHDESPDVRWDAQAAIKTLQSKPEKTTVAAKQ